MSKQIKKEEFNSTIRIKLIKVNFLDDEKLFQKALEQVSLHRINKVQKYRFRKDKNLSLGAGLALDFLLKQIGLNEKDMEYQTGKYGKLKFKNYPNVHFNISHSGNYAICAIAPIEIGIDIEIVTDYQKDVAEQFCSKDEIDFIETLSEKNRAYYFTRLWTLKESFLKKLGCGIIDKKFFPKFIPNNLPTLQDSRYSDYDFKELELKGYCISLCFENKNKKK